MGSPSLEGKEKLAVYGGEGVKMVLGKVLACLGGEVRGVRESIGKRCDGKLVGEVMQCIIILPGNSNAFMK